MNIGTLLGDNDLENMFKRIDGLNKSLSKNIKRSDPDITDAALREMLKMIQDDDGQTSEEMTDINKLFNKLSVSSARLMRYKTYDEIYKNVSLLKRIVTVFLNNTLQIDVMTNTALQIKELEGGNGTGDSSENKYYINYCKDFVEHYKIEKELKQTILPHMLRYGDHFIEIIDIMEDVVDFKPLRQQQQMITENNLRNLNEKINKALKTNNANGYNQKASFDDAVDSMTKLFVEVNDVSTLDTDVYNTYSQAVKVYEEAKSDKSDNDSLEDTEINDKNKQSEKQVANEANKTNTQFDEERFNQVLLRFHEPKKISILRTEYGSIIGYVEILSEHNKEVTPGVTAQFAQVINALGDGNKKAEGNSKIIKGIVNNIISSLIKKIEVPESKAVNGKNLSHKEALASYEKAIRKELGDDLFVLIKQLFIEVNPKSRTTKKLKVRFISKERMVHCCHNPIEYDPYGTSVLDSLVYPAKLYMLTQLSNVMHKLSRSSQVRKWTLETGPREHHSGLVQKLKRELRNQRVSVDDVMSFKSVPNILSDFKDIVLLSKKGQRFVDVDMQQMGDPNVRVADLEDFRRELIALSGVPAPYLGYNDAVELRDHLVHINVSFASEIINVQQVINESMQELTRKVGKILNLKENPNDYVRVSLRPPVILLLQMIETIMASITNIQQNLQATNLNFNPYYLLKRFLPTIDWDEFAEEAEEFEMFMKAKGKNSEEGGPGRF